MLEANHHISEIHPAYTDDTRKLVLDYTLQLADSSLIIGHRLSEWCGHGPILEQDIAMQNIALDLLGETRSLFQYAAELEGQGRTEDDLAFLREAVEYKNSLITEQPNGDFAQTILRQFLFDTYHFYLLQQLKGGKDQRLSAIAEKSLKEVSYHIKWSSEWVIRLGDGTDESRQRIEKAIANLWPYTGELFTMTATEEALLELGIIPNYSLIKQQWEEYVERIFAE
ncbi:MAG: phenylacetate-CoA oxygenase subunit PaaI, partial [Sphingobacteriales bacterium]